MTMTITPQMKKEIVEEALEYWINHNYLVAQGIKNSVEWLDEEEEEDTICDRCGHKDIEWCMSDGCCDEEEELDAWCYSCGKNFSADTEQGGDDGTEEEEWVCNSCFKDINNSSRIVEYN